MRRPFYRRLKRVIDSDASYREPFLNPFAITHRRKTGWRSLYYHHSAIWGIEPDATVLWPEWVEPE